MGQAAVPSRYEPIRPVDMVVSSVVLFAFAVTQPLLDLLGRNAEFFLARGAPPLDIVSLALLLAVVVPLGLGLLILGVGRIHQPTGRAAHAALLALLGAVLALQIIDHTPLRRLPGWAQIALAALVGLSVVVAYRRFDGFRSLMRFGVIAPVVFLILFLFASSASPLVFRAAVTQPAAVTVGDPAPVIMVLFDEFPVASLMDGEGNLQEELYPNFARLSDDGTWFRNATTVQQQTEAALPAILTGVDPPSGRLPMAPHYPASLFTLLSDTHDIQATEAVTEMCPEYACDNETRPVVPTSRRWSTLVDDLRIVAGHLFLPDDMTRTLPPIDQSWSGFGEDPSDPFNIIARFNERLDEDRRIPITRFIESIDSAAEEPALYFLHALVPHIPWSYLPSGQIHTPPSPLPGSETTGWGDDEWLADQAYQLHLVQVQYVDTIVGQLIERLEEAGLYDDALLVVMADHGITVRPDIVHRRVATADTVGDIAAVPLFIKRPNQEAGGADDYPALTTDVLPTIADVLDIDVPWRMDGVSLFAADRPERTQRRITGGEGVIDVGSDGSAARQVAARKIDHFGDNGPYGLAPPGHADLLGLALDEVAMGPPSDVAATVANLGGYSVVDTDAPVLPTIMRGTLTSERELTDDEVVAIGVNGEIAAVTRSYSKEEAKAFYALLPPEALIDGANQIELMLVEGSGAARSLRPVEISGR